MTITADEVKSRIVRRGIEDTVTKAISVDSVDDAELRTRLQAARDAIKAVDMWMRDRYGDDYMWD